MAPLAGSTRAAAIVAMVVATYLGAPPLAAQTDTSVNRTLVVAYPPQQFSLDPLHTFSTTEAQLFTAVYEGLVAYDPITLNPVAGQAERWEISRDRTTYTFHLRADARFSNGDPLRAEDFRASWLRILDPGAAAEYSFLFDVIKGVAEYRGGELNDPKRVGIRAVSDRVLEVELTEPADHFLKVLAHHSFSAIHSGYLGALNWDRAGQLTGNGPYRVTSWTDRELVLERNEYYWGSTQVELDRIVVRFYDNPEEVTRAFLQGEIHWANTWANDRRMAPYVVANPLFATTYFYFRSDREPFDDERVRRGLALLLPWDEIRNTAQMFFPSDVLVPDIADYPEVVGIRDRDERSGLKLLDQAGYARGRGLPPISIKVAAGSVAVQVAELMRDTWEGLLGVEVAVQEFRYRDLLEEIRGGDFTLAHQTWVGDFADPLTFLQMWMRSSNLNDAAYFNRQYDRAVQRALRATGAERLQALARAEEMLLEQAVILPVSHMVAFNLVNRGRVDGWYPNALDIHPFRFIRFRAVQGPRGVAAAPPATANG
jgi:peptide/nickel transport system substrate-binding protein/oligopeptide transport system substrate-binding protein